MKRIISLCIAVLYAMLTVQAQSLYEITNDNVNVRTSPINGKVFRQIKKSGTIIEGWEENGWVSFQTAKDGTPCRGFISSQFTKKIAEQEFSRSMLGSYIGTTDREDVSYSLAKLWEKDGFVVLTITDYTEPLEDSGGMRGQFTFNFAGVPAEGKVIFTHSLNGIYDMPMVNHLTKDSAMEHPAHLTVGANGTLYFMDWKLDLQESEGKKDQPLTERSIFMLSGNVKSAKHLRVYAENFLQNLQAENEADEYSDGFIPLKNFHKTLVFSPQGDLVSYADRNGSGELIEEYKFTHSGNDVKMVSKRCEASYRRKTGNFFITYNEGKSTEYYYEEDGTRQEGGGSMIGETFDFNMNGCILNHFFVSSQPPFFTHGAGEGDFIGYAYADNPLSPVAANIRLDYGGDSWTFYVVFKEVKFDSHGNWTERKAYADEKFMFIERRIIEYYP